MADREQLPLFLTRKYRLSRKQEGIVLWLYRQHLHGMEAAMYKNLRSALYIDPAVLARSIRRLKAQSFVPLTYSPGSHARTVWLTSQGMALGRCLSPDDRI